MDNILLWTGMYIRSMRESEKFEWLDGKQQKASCYLWDGGWRLLVIRAQHRKKRITCRHCWWGQYSAILSNTQSHRWLPPQPTYYVFATNHWALGRVFTQPALPLSSAKLPRSRPARFPFRATAGIGNQPRLLLEPDVTAWAAAPQGLIKWDFSFYWSFISDQVITVQPVAFSIRNSFCLIAALQTLKVWHGQALV